MGRENATERRRRREERRIKEKTKQEREAKKEAHAEQRAAQRNDLDDIDNALLELEKERKRIEKVVVENLPENEQPSLRFNCVFAAHPTKDELILHGGERCDGDAQHVFDDLYIYSIKKNRWRSVKSPTQPLPRCGHSCVVREKFNGQMFVFGGEYSSRGASVFRHYGDMWLLHLEDMKWECIYDGSPEKKSIASSGGGISANIPTPRSGHRMAIVGKNIVLYGGFHDNGRGVPKYFNDCFLFNLEDYTWRAVKTDPACFVVPAPRSAFQFFPMDETTAGSSKTTSPALSLSLILMGGYSRQRVKGEVEKSVIHQDAFKLIIDINEPKADDVIEANKSKSAKSSVLKNTPTVVYETLRFQGASPVTLQGLRMAQMPTSGDLYGFGGIQEIEIDDTTLKEVYLAQVVGLSVDKLRWMSLNVSHGGRVYEKLVELAYEKTLNALEQKKRRKARSSKDKSTGGSAGASRDNLDFPSDNISSATGNLLFWKNPATVCFKEDSDPLAAGSSPCLNAIEDIWPAPRANAGVACHGKVLYIYGGYYEKGERQVALSDLVSLDLSKPGIDRWHVLQETLEHRWQGDSDEEYTESSDSDSEGSDSD